MHCFKKCLFVITSLLYSLGLCTPVLAKPVTMDRILREHKVYIVTTETAESLDKYWLDWRPKAIKLMPMTEYYLNRNRLDDGGFVIFIIDRSKTKRMLPEEEAMLPCPAGGITSNEVIAFASMNGSKRSPIRNNRWDIMISAPNSKWLHSELARIGEYGILNRNLEERGTLLDRYKIKRLSVVSTEGRQLAEDWIRRQCIPGKDTIDWDFIEANSWDPNSTTGMDLLFLLTKEKLNGKSLELVKQLPQDLQEWCNSDRIKSESCVEKRAVQTGTEQFCATSVVCAPCQRQLKLMLGRYNTLDSIPQSLSAQRLTDLRGYNNVIVVARFADRNQQDSAGVVDTLASHVTSSLASGMGFQCVTRQDLKELIYEAVPRGQENISPEEAEKIRSKVGAYAIAVADLATLSTSTSYSGVQPRCLTGKYSAFSKPEPTEPSKPDPDERTYGFFGPHKYPKRSHDKHYKDDLEEYYHDYEEYKDNHRSWQYERDQYESSRSYHDMEWETGVDAIQSAKVAGTVRIYDLGSYSEESAGKVLWSCQFEGSDEHRSSFKYDRVVVRGEDAMPSTPSTPDSHQSIADQTVITEAISRSCSGAAGQLLKEALLPCDGPADMPEPKIAQPVEPQITEKKIPLKLEVVGKAKLSRKPAASDTELARQAALSDAYLMLLNDLSTTCPDVRLSQDELRNQAQLVSEGWNPEAGEYRVRVKIEKEMIVKVPQNEVKI